MISGLGVDLVALGRIERAMRRRGFTARILTPAEREHCRTVAQVAGRWAAKEAVAKAIGRPLSWQAVEVLPGTGGAPVARCADGVLSPGERVHVSISHERSHAVAVALVERPGP